MAQSGARTLIIDGDLRRPRIHKIFQTGENKGLSALLVGTCELGEAIIPTDIENVDRLKALTRLSPVYDVVSKGTHVKVQIEKK